MESKFKIGELVKVVDDRCIFHVNVNTAKDMGLINWLHTGEILRPCFNGLNAYVVAIGNSAIGIRMALSGTSHVCAEHGLESLDNPPKPKKELTHMVVFRAILRSGILPACTCNVKSQVGPYLQTNWSERNELGRIKYFVTLTGERKTIEEVTEQFGE